MEELEASYMDARNIKWCSHFENRLALSSNVKRGYQMPQPFPSRSIPKRPESRNMQCCLHTHVHSHVSHSSQKVETAQADSDRWTDEQHVVYTYSGILFSLKKEENSDTCYTIDKPWGHEVKWNKPVVKDKYCITTLIRDIQNHQIHRDRR